MPGPSRGALVASAVISVFILVIWATLIVTLQGLGQSDAAGNGLAQAYAAAEIALVWGLLAVLLLVTGISGGMAWQIAYGSMALLLVSAFASIQALPLLVDHDSPPFLWPIITPALVPPIVMAFCLCLLFPAARRAVPTRYAAGIAAGAVLLLCAAQWPLAQIRDQAQEHEAQARGKWMADFLHVPADAPLWDWTPFLNTPDENRQYAVLARIRKLDRRQSDAETMLDRGDFPLKYLGQMDLDPTPVICDKTRALLRRRVQKLISPAAGSRPYTDVADEVAGALAAMQWLVGYGCSCDTEAQEWEAMANGYRDTNFDVVELRELRDPKALGRTLREAPDRFSMLTPQSSLRAWLKFAANDDTYRQAIEGARKLDHRTQDAVEMLRHDEYDASTVLAYLPLLDLQPTKELCDASLKVLREKFARVYRPPPDDPRPYTELLDRLGTGAPLVALVWLESHGCDAGAMVTEAEALVRAYKDSFARSRMLQMLAESQTGAAPATPR